MAGGNRQSVEICFGKGKRNPKIPGQFPGVFYQPGASLICGAQLKINGLLNLQLIAFAKFHCVECGLRFLSARDHAVHNWKMHGNRDWECPICCHTVVTEAALDEHTILFHPGCAMYLPPPPPGDGAAGAGDGAAGGAGDGAAPAAAGGAPAAAAGGQD